MPVGFTQSDSRSTLFNLSTGGAATPPPRPKEEIMRGNQAKEWDGQLEDKDNMDVY